MLSTDDHLAIHELIALHGHLMDDGAFDRLDELFTADIAYDLEAFGGGVLRGPAAIRDAGLALGDGNPLGHHVTNVIVTGGDDQQAHARSKGFGVMADGTVGSVVYEDVLTRTPEGWRISYRKVVPRKKPLTR